MRRFPVPLIFACAALIANAETLPPWSPGTLDIHQIQTGRGNSTFFVFPDGTTMLLDAGAVPERQGLELGPARPDGSTSPAASIAAYVKQFSPKPAIDTALVTHYHDDHMGAIAEVARIVPVGRLVDRGENPEPAPGALLERYRAFRRTFGTRAEVIEVGAAGQLGPKYPEFEFRAVAGNGLVWTGQDEQAKRAIPENWNHLPKEEQPGENHFSIALRLRYGRFRYFTGGDLPGVALDNLPAWQDLETPVARVTGPVDVCVLNHHGWLDSTNGFFLRTLRPRVVVIPAWHASHPDHGVIRRLVSERVAPGPRDLFITGLLDAPAAIFRYLGTPFRSTEGHVVVRVAPGGAEYSVIVLDASNVSRPVLKVFGPYASR